MKAGDDVWIIPRDVPLKTPLARAVEKDEEFYLTEGEAWDAVCHRITGSLNRNAEDTRNLERRLEEARLKRASCK